MAGACDHRTGRGACKGSGSGHAAGCPEESGLNAGPRPGGHAPALLQCLLLRREGDARLASIPVAGYEWQVMSYETLLFDVADRVATITLNRPKAANSLDLTMGRELMQAAICCDEDPEVRAVVVTATGKMFCAGGDLRSFAAELDRLPFLLKELTVYLHAAISRMARMDAPVVNAINGTAAGAGMSLAVAGDFVIAAESARFTMSYTRAGLAPDGSSTYYLPRLIGSKRTLDLMITNRVLSASEAMEWGLVGQVVADDELASAAAKLAAELAEGPTHTFGMVKRLVQGSFGESLETQMELEARAIAECGGSPDGREGITAFLEKRPPKFTGRS